MKEQSKHYHTHGNQDNIIVTYFQRMTKLFFTEKIYRRRKLGTSGKKKKKEEDQSIVNTIDCIFLS